MRLAPLVFAILAISCQRGRATDEDRGTSVSRPIEGTAETPPAAPTPEPETQPEPELETPPDPAVGGIYGPADSPAKAANDDYEAQLYDRSLEDDPRQDTATETESTDVLAPEADDPWTATSTDPWAGTRARRQPAPSTTEPMPPQPSPPPR